MIDPLGTLLALATGLLLGIMVAKSQSTSKTYYINQFPVSVDNELFIRTEIIYTGTIVWSMESKFCDDIRSIKCRDYQSAFVIMRELKRPPCSKK